MLLTRFYHGPDPLSVVCDLSKTSINAYPEDL